ncbi:glycoside hydrolase family 140 protein [Algoriphagus pacificus]|uniref:Glycoside hydrolase family 140 protein n=1 Tax=Algoriphagus pacificus TaxID=2811234 RepID=A0ABS3CKW8_9BACT|nr:glycoside hydrolase family 140 protein [Algoriphagus pacificus]MBN7817753.1 glycoside hydrolase family 140 protein [Algoriphagus pacificus]
MSKSLSTFFLVLLLFQANAQENLPKVLVHPDQKYLMTADGKPFFWLADTAWELLHRLDLEETEFYLETRKKQGFNVIQAVALAELDGINDPNAYGEKPFKSLQTWEYNEAYFQHIDQVFKLAAEKGFYIAFLPTWGDKLFKNSWGTGPEIFTPESAYNYGKWIGKRYKDQTNLIWVIGGDRNPRENSEDIYVWNEMARGIKDSGASQLMTFHPQPSSPGGSSNWFHQESWLDFNMHQTGHCPNQPTYQKILHDLSLSPTKPSIDGEPMYEEHPKCFNAKELGYSEAADIRRIMYWNVFAGAAGQSYGCHAVWQMYDLDKTPVNAPLKPWNLSLDLEMANQVKHLKEVILSRNYFDRINDQSLIANSQEDNDEFVVASRGNQGEYAMFYFPTGKETALDLSNLQGEKFEGNWFDPRTGVSFGSVILEGKKNIVTPPSQGRGNDWVLILDSIN